MKKFVFVSLLMASLPFLVLAQSVDDLYYIPKKKVEKKEKVKTWQENIRICVYLVLDVPEKVLRQD